MDDEKKDLFTCLSAAACPEYRTECTDGIGAVCGNFGHCEVCLHCKYTVTDTCEGCIRRE